MTMLHTYPRKDAKKGWLDDQYTSFFTLSTMSMPCQPSSEATGIVFTFEKLQVASGL